MWVSKIDLASHGSRHACLNICFACEHILSRIACAGTVFFLNKKFFPVFHLLVLIFLFLSVSVSAAQAKFPVAGGGLLPARAVGRHLAGPTGF